MLEFKYLPTPTIVGVPQEEQISNKIVNIMNNEIKKLNSILNQDREVNGNNYAFLIDDVIIHGKNTLDGYCDKPVYTSDMIFDTFRDAIDAHKEIIKELTNYFRDNKNYNLDITKNIILNVTFLGSFDGLNHTPLNTIYIIQGQ